LTPSPEYKTRFLTKTFRSPYYGCYVLAVIIFGLGIFRDYLFKSALADQPRYPPVHQPILAYGLIASGNVLVLTSMWALGVTGTYLGDYFGILMDSKVEGFPFNVTSAPMYWGSTMSFLGYALLTGKVAGLILTAEILVMYLIALQFEEYVPHYSGWRVLT
jgi:phosphatidylethanolamine/phosphatidyl-N-methylethanolamine N-methyltransferase